MLAGMVILLRTRNTSVKPLVGLALFAGCGERDLLGLESLMTRVDVVAGRELTRSGERGEEFFVVANGHAEVRQHGRVIAGLGPGSFFGEMALLDGGLRTATVIAATPMELYVLSKREFRELLDSSPTVARNMLRSMSSRLRSAA
jgi:CRP-like cAMP-binding protein